VERGTHGELLALGGRYTSMWEKQSKAEEAASFARDASAHADRLMRRAHLTKKKEQEDRSDGFNSMMSSTVLQTEPPTPNESSPAGSEASSDDESNTTVRKTCRQKAPAKGAFDPHPTVAEEEVDFDGSTYGTSASDTMDDADLPEGSDAHEGLGGRAASEGSDSVSNATAVEDEPTSTNASTGETEVETTATPSGPPPHR